MNSLFASNFGWSLIYRKLKSLIITYVPTVPVCLLFLCAHRSSVPTFPLCPPFLCAHRSSVPTVPLCPLFLCAHCIIRCMND